MGRIVVSACRNGSARTGAPPLAGWLLQTRYKCMGRWLDGVGQSNISNHQKGSATVGAGTGAPLLALEGRRAIRSGRWHQFRWCCKDAEYFCRRSKIIQIECTQIRTFDVVLDSIKRTYDRIRLWLHTTINCTYNVIVPK